LVYTTTHSKENSTDRKYRGYEQTEKIARNVAY
ncbi:hypothetical protein WwAna1839, partial [Wolbachia endosymbiont of Drosophila ananassae]